MMTQTGSSPTTALRTRRRIAVTLAVIAALLGLALILSVIALRQTDDDDGDPFDRAVELWAHERLMERRGDGPQMPFTSDGCSGGMSAIWRDLTAGIPSLAQRIGGYPPWESCCTAHDRAYYGAGGARTPQGSYRARRRADARLRACVADMAPGAEFQALADAMYLAVRVGGGPCSGLTWRWGYGLPGCW